MRTVPRALPPFLAAAVLAALPALGGDAGCGSEGAGPPCSEVPGSLDDGLIEVHFTDTERLVWLPDPPHHRFNVYRTALETLLTTGDYTEPPGAFDAARICDLPAASHVDAFEPLPGEAVLYLVTGEIDLVEQELGADSSGTVRRNAAPCPTDPDPLLVEVLTSKTTYAVGESVDYCVEFTNISPTEPLLNVVGRSCWLRFKTEDLLGQVLADPIAGIFCNHAELEFPLAPGESARHCPGTWRFDQPGTYVIRGHYNEPGAVEGITGITVE